MLKRIRWYLWILAGIFLAYLAASVYFMEHFFLGTAVNGENVEFQTVKQVNSLILEQAEGYGLTLLERGGTEESVTAQQLGMSFSETENVRNYKRVQNGFLWPRMFWQQDTYQIAPDITFDEETFDETLASLSCVREGEEPEDARVELTADGYELYPEQQGSRIKEDVLKEQVRAAAETLTETVDLEEAGCYEAPSLTADSPEITELTAKLDQWFATEVTYEFGSQTEVVDSSVVAGFIQLDGCEASLSEEAVRAWVAGLADRRDTYKKSRQFNSTLRGVITVSGGNYGWQIDQETETAALLASVEKGETAAKQPAWSREGKAWGDNNDVGDTYIEVDMGAQHMWAYKDGALLIDTDVVTGNISRNYGTPSMVAAIQYKDRNAVLRGDNYATPVKYWMPFYGNYGIHDASWRREFGGTVYLTNGSHGCVNTPPAAMKVIFENMDSGTPVVLYY
ncbi:MAG TPA: peptidoglycan binding domain-containing protein [Candidatus Merdisoma faecalis]|uniref:L,D-transpeptidase family protein n=1 Tax=Lachnoclostridium sp. An138 TaxID=1965560 RepID=UPI0013A67E2E|nr:L,D-transpeptidase family protein [Lachnoclostridium sp. An138]HIR97736.1 peptidoglycan binding domain-containing protein [Candidatus Merdisoma faecalis]